MSLLLISFLISFFFAVTIVLQRRRFNLLARTHYSVLNTNESLRAEIIEHRKIEAALRQSESDLAEAQRVAHIGSWNYNIHTNTVRWSNELYRIFDIEKNSFDGTFETVIAKIHPKDRAHVMLVNTNARSNGKPFELEYRIQTRDGQQKYIREIGYAQLDNSGFIAGLYGTAQDVTERKTAEGILLESEIRFRALIENTSDGIELIDEHGTIIYATPATYRMLGYTDQEYFGKNIFDLVYSDDREYTATKLKHLLEVPGSRTTAEARVLHKNGSLLWLEGVGTNLLHEPSIRAIVINYTDITERKRAEETIRLQSARAQMLANMSQTLSHRLLEVQENERRMIARELHDEIGQILTATKIDLQVIKQRNLSSDLQSRIEDNIVILDRCLQQVRNLSLDLRPSVLDDLGLVAALRWQLNRLSQHAGFKAAFIADDLTERFSTEFETSCFRIAQETLTNISKHANAHNVELTFKIIDGCIEMNIKDDGKGFNVDNAITNVMHGATFGILSMQERVNLIGGTLEITSKEGSGAAVHVRIPIRDQKIDDHSTEKEQQ